MLISLKDMQKLTEEQLYELYRKNFSNAIYELFKISNMVINYDRALGMHVFDTDEKSQLKLAIDTIINAGKGIIKYSTEK